MPIIHQPQALTFDCYGTLIDWERGLLKALHTLLEAHGATAPDDQLLERYGNLEAAQEAGPYLRYREILRRVAEGIGQELGFSPTDAECEAFAGSVPAWPPFPDTAPALERLAQRYKLVVITNCDDDLFAGSAQHFPVTLSDVITAQQVGSYKPNHANFEAALERIGLPKDQVLHVAQSLFHDIAPARALGLTTVWVNRRAGRHGSGATPPAAATPNYEVPDLTSLVALLGA